MRKIIFLAIFIFPSSKISAQQNTSLYIAGSLGVSNISPASSDIKSKPSKSLGANLKIRLAKKIYLVLQPALAFRGYENITLTNDYNIKTTYIDIPLAIEYHFAFGDNKNLPDQNSFFIGAGIYEGIALSGKYRDMSANNGDIKLKFGESVFDNRSATDFGFNLVAGVQNKNFRIGLQYEKGSRNVVPKGRQPGNNKINLNNYSLFFAYKLYRRN